MYLYITSIHSYCFFSSLHAPTRHLQAHEYRDILEDILTMVAEPLENVGLEPDDIQSFMCCTISMVQNYISLRPGFARQISAPSDRWSERGGAYSRQHSTSTDSSRPDSTRGVSGGSGGSSSGATSGAGLGLGNEGQGLASLSREEQMGRDWIRFVTCCRLCLRELV
jgi:hypothetical protein